MTTSALPTATSLPPSMGLPTSVATGRVDSPRQPCAPSRSSGPMHVLLVDDDRVTRLLIRRALVKGPRSVRVFEASSLEAAREVLSAHAIDCVLLDLSLPDGNGAELLQELQHRDETNPATVVLTGTPADSHAASLLGMGAEDFLVKLDAEPHDIRRAVTFAVERHRVRKALSAENKALVKAVHHDPLTGLLNRRGLAAALHQRTGEGMRFGILVDLDDFKAINDTFGHDVGDAAICATADALRRSTRPQDLLCRVGGDEFAIVCEATDTTAPIGLAHRVCAAVAEIVSAVPTLAQHGHRATASVGIAALDNSAGTGSDLLAACTHAVHDSKAAGKGCVRVAPGTLPHSHAPLAFRVPLRLRVDAAPIHSLATGEIEGWEYSVRPPPAFRGSTHAFLQHARATRQLAAVEVGALGARIRASQQHTNSGRIHLPLTADGLLNGKLQDMLIALAHGHRQVVVSLWEQPGAWSPPSVQAAVTKLRRAGVRLGLARVGRGSTTLEALLCLEPFILRVDPTAAVCDPSTEPGRRRLRTLATLAAGVGARIVYPMARGPESHPRLLGLGVDMVAGRSVCLGAYSTER